MMSSPIFAISPYGREGASSRVRLRDWFDHLGLNPTYIDYRGAKNNSAHEMAKDLRGVGRAECRLRRLDTRGRTVVMSKEASPLSTGATEQRLLRCARHSVFDFDDAMFIVTLRARAALRPATKLRRSVASAGVVLAGNEYLADWASQFNADVRVIPSCVEPRNYHPKSSWTIDRATPRLVWLGSPTTEQYVAQIAPALIEVHRRTGAILHLISGPTHNGKLGLLGPMLRRIRWTETTVCRELARADVAIGPLPDTTFTRGKCAYKLLQYAATGLPMVASPVGSNDLAIKRFAGLAASTIDEWTDALISLITGSESARGNGALSAIAAVQEHYSFASWSDAWLSAAQIPTPPR
jgi:glycosyltransferase involved in cell wall biosynthesis